MIQSLAVVVGYALAFFPLGALFGPGTMAFAMIPVGVVGLLHGARAGALAGIVAFPVNAVLLDLVGYRGLELVAGVAAPGSIALVVLGAVAGWVRDLSDRLDGEALRLQHERDALKMQTADLRRSDGALRASYAHVRSVLRSLPIVVFAYDSEGVVQLAEGEGLEVLGFAANQMVGASVRAADERVPGALQSFERALAGEAFTTMHRFGRRVYEVRYAPLRGSDGEVMGVIGVATGIVSVGAHEPEPSAQA